SVDGAPRFGLARLLADGALDTSFVTPDWSQGGGSPTVTAILLQPDGKVVMAGYWRAPSMLTTIVLARFNADGSPDAGFVNPVVDSYYSTITTLALDKDGKLLVGGKFTSVAGVAQTGIVRLNGDGTLDAGFHADVDADVMTIQPQPDGKILIGGWFGTVNGVGRTRIARLDAQGQLDTGFVPALTDDVFLNVQNIALQADGSMAIAGFADGYMGHVGRLNADGTTDPSLELTADGPIAGLGQQADGKLLVTGDFGTIAGGTRQRLARLQADGTLDAGFSVNVDGAINSVAQLNDGRLLITGPFTTVDGVARASLALLRADGSLDTSYTLQPPGGYNVVSTLTRQADGRIVLGGNFDRLGSHSIPGGVARLNADGTWDSGFVGPVLDVKDLAVDPQNRVLAVGPIFAKQYGFVRLRTDGTEDASFVLPQDLMWGLFDQVERLAVQADGSILLAGPFTFTRDTRTWKNLLRVLPDGSLDEAFRPNPDGAVNDVVVQPDGGIVVVGAFAQIGGV
ncbi:MAG TPA: hypothetical protein VN153_02630, partial [Tahibacter sp.]|nr:hypothetical protein [Tahibacter sp.]